MIRVSTPRSPDGQSATRPDDDDEEQGREAARRPAAAGLRGEQVAGHARGA
jgi:hypothetical protein